MSLYVFRKKAALFGVNRRPARPARPRPYHLAKCPAGREARQGTRTTTLPAEAPAVDVEATWPGLRDYPRRSILDAAVSRPHPGRLRRAAVAGR